MIDKEGGHVAYLVITVKKKDSARNHLNTGNSSRYTCYLLGPRIQTEQRVNTLKNEPADPGC